MNTPENSSRKQPARAVALEHKGHARRDGEQRDSIPSPVSVSATAAAKHSDEAPPPPPRPGTCA